MESSLSLEAFNHLDHFYNGLIPQVDLGSGDSAPLFVWVCNYGGMKFFRPMTIAEAMEATIKDIAKQN